MADDQITQHRFCGLFKKPGHLVIAVLALAVLVFLIYAMGWRLIAARVQQELSNPWMNSETANLHLQWKKITVSGFPWSIKATLTEPRLAMTITTAPAKQTPLWQSDFLVLKSRPWDFSRIQFNAPGDHVFYQNARPLTLSVAEFSGTLSGLSKPGTDPVIEISARGIRLPEKWQTALGRSIKSLIFKIGLTGSFKNLTRPAVVAWREGGGTIELERLNAEYGPLKMQTGGTFSLDRDLQIIGALSARILGHQDTVDALLKARIINSTEAFSARLIFAVMQKSSPLGPVLNVPVTIQDRRLSIGPLNIMTLPRLWP